MIRVNGVLDERLSADGEFDAAACMDCGSCTALCPLETGVMPRRLFRYALMGAKDKVLENSESIYSCMLCRMCEANCPAGVHIAENVRLLRNYINRTVYGLSRS